MEGGFWESIAGNQYFSAGFGLLGVGTGLAIFKNACLRGSFWLRRKYTMTLEIPSRDPSYLWMLQWCDSIVDSHPC